ncbi:hypothetical protein J8273_3847 [Carpediemonas membranifera]|uniref:Uncharacterized protein n=1 Tax=Carpediemonas membranifera TaxID=201153 RepID=A0A8J6B2Y9_9EUKA|nr:hypothetical protein J8273_3847 [Carpediemonas membranifera]|eukprot:KAG9394593.1 hypothetical protein J8273_3847 [Carpediemonas membranifera]
MSRMLYDPDGSLQYSSRSDSSLTSIETGFGDMENSFDRFSPYRQGNSPLSAVSNNSRLKIGLHTIDIELQRLAHDNDELASAHDLLATSLAEERNRAAALEKQLATMTNELREQTELVRHQSAVIATANRTIEDLRAVQPHSVVTDDANTQTDPRSYDSRSQSDTSIVLQGELSQSSTVVSLQPITECDAESGMDDGDSKLGSISSIGRIMFSLGLGETAESPDSPVATSDGKQNTSDEKHHSTLSTVPSIPDFYDADAVGDRDDDSMSLLTVEDVDIPDNDSIVFKLSHSRQNSLDTALISDDSLQTRPGELHIPRLNLTAASLPRAGRDKLDSQPSSDSDAFSTTPTTLSGRFSRTPTGKGMHRRKRSVFCHSSLVERGAWAWKYPTFPNGKVTKRFIVFDPTNLVFSWGHDPSSQTAKISVGNIRKIVPGCLSPMFWHGTATSPSCTQPHLSFCLQLSNGQVLAFTAATRETFLAFFSIMHKSILAQTSPAGRMEWWASFTPGKLLWFTMSRRLWTLSRTQGVRLGDLFAEAFEDETEMTSNSVLDTPPTRLMRKLSTRIATAVMQSPRVIDRR